MELYRTYLAATRRISVDAAVDDYLDWCRLAFANAGSHHTTQEAVANVLPRTRRQFGVMLIGHGAEGFLTAGCGNAGMPVPDNCLHLGNVGYWKPQLVQLAGNTRIVTLLGCYTGAGPRGLALLREVACAVRGRALAPTEIVWAFADGKIRLAEGSRWQTVTCRGFATPIPAMNLSGIKRRFTSAGHKPSPPAAPGLGIVIDVKFFPRDGLGERVAHFQGFAAESLMRLVDPFPHVVPNGGPLALLTGTIQLTELDRTGGERERTFRVYADRILQDEADTALFFEGGRDFAEALRVRSAPRGEDAPGGALSGSR